MSQSIAPICSNKQKKYIISFDIDLVEFLNCFPLPELLLHGLGPAKFACRLTTSKKIEANTIIHLIYVSNVRNI